MRANVELVKALIDESPEKIAGIGVHALEVLAQQLSTVQFKKFLKEAEAASDKMESRAQADRFLSQQELNHVLRNGNVKEAVRESGDTARIMSKDGRSLGRIRTKLPFITSTGEIK